MKLPSLTFLFELNCNSCCLLVPFLLDPRRVSIGLRTINLQAMSIYPTDTTISSFNFELNTTLPSFLSSCPLPTFLLPPTSTWTTISSSSSSSSHDLPSPLWSNSAARTLAPRKGNPESIQQHRPSLPLEERSVVLLRSLVARLLLEEAHGTDQDEFGLPSTTTEEGSTSSHVGKEVKEAGTRVAKQLPSELVVFSLERAGFHPIITFLDPPPPTLHLSSSSNPLPASSQLIVLQLFPLPAAPSSVDAVIPPIYPLVELEGYPTPSWTVSPSSEAELEHTTASPFAFPDPQDELRTKILLADDPSRVEDLFAKTTSSRRTSSVQSSERRESSVVSGLPHLESVKEGAFVSTKELMESFNFAETSLGPVSLLLLCSSD